MSYLDTPTPMLLDIEMDCKLGIGQGKRGHMDYVPAVLISGPAHTKVTRPPFEAVTSPLQNGIGYRPTPKSSGNMGEGRPRGVVCGLSQNSSPLGTHTTETTIAARGNLLCLGIRPKQGWYLAVSWNVRKGQHLAE
jgi:hypothetical protein